MIKTEEKFQEIYDKYKNLIMKMAFEKLKDFHLAQDICQETFIKLYGYQDTLDEDRVKSWLLVVAANLIRDHYKKSGTRREFLDEDGLVMDLNQPDNSMEEYLRLLGVREFEIRILESLREKNTDWYEVLLLVEYLQVPRKLIAKQRGIALSTVDAHLYKAKKWLVSQYQEEYENL